MLIYVRLSGLSLSRLVNLHLSRSKITQRAIREHSESTQSIKIRVNTVGDFKYCVFLLKVPNSINVPTTGIAIYLA